MVDKKKLLALGEKLATLPDGKKYFRKISKIFNDRLEAIKEDKLDWGSAEMLAYATLLEDGHPVRVSGQDVERGTFSHRHAVVKTEDTEEEVITLNLLSDKQAKFSIYNSFFCVRKCPRRTLNTPSQNGLFKSYTHLCPFSKSKFSIKSECLLY